MRRYGRSFAALVLIAGLVACACASLVGAHAPYAAVLIGLALPMAADPLVFWLVASSARASQSVFMTRWALTFVVKLLFLGLGSAVAISAMGIEPRPLLLALAFGFIVCLGHLSWHLTHLVKRPAEHARGRALESTA